MPVWEAQRGDREKAWEKGKSGENLKLAAARTFKTEDEKSADLHKKESQGASCPPLKGGRQTDARALGKENRGSSRDWKAGKKKAEKKRRESHGKKNIQPSGNEKRARIAGKVSATDPLPI